MTIDSWDGGTRLQAIGRVLLVARPSLFCWIIVGAALGVFVYSIIGKTTCWNPSLAWAILVAVMSATGILHLSRPSEFLYWQF
jgi:hypothetical protein